MLDPDRQRDAAIRIEALLAEAGWHRDQAEALARRAAALAQSWGIGAGESLDTDPRAAVELNN